MSYVEPWLRKRGAVVTHDPEVVKAAAPDSRDPALPCDPCRRGSAGHPRVPHAVSTPKTAAGHVIRAIHFSKAWPSGEAPTECTCGWEGKGDAFSQHRREVGQPYKPFSAVRARAGDGR